MFRALVIATVAGTATMLLPQGGAHAAGKWCAYYRFDATNCGFDTYEQCRASVSGVGGDCGQSPWS
jgi:Protein of unknown function (DUF3551)